MGFQVSLCDLFGEVQGNAIDLIVKETLDALFDEYCHLYKPLTPQGKQSSGAKPEVEKANASSGAAFYAQELRKKLKEQMEDEESLR